ncbi:hypothetical protein Syun_002612 [Stephania yunnanensis]|uniref:Cytochrome P450 n=1 Tax=Stephania yunnanensis TaxID=152371 RepID=A0AAP0LFP2_9MAGN
MGSRTLIIVASAHWPTKHLFKTGRPSRTDPPSTRPGPSSAATSSLSTLPFTAPPGAPFAATWSKTCFAPAESRSFLSYVIQDTHEYKKNTVRVLKNARFAVFCILLSMCFGVPMSDEEIEKVDDILKKVLVTLLPRIDDFLPMFGMLFFNQRKRVMEVRRAQIQTILPLIERRRSMIQNLGSDESAPSFAYIDTLFDLKLEGRKSSTPSDEELVTLCSEFLDGGTDTTSTAIEWGIGRLIQQPECQSKLFEEIKSTVGDRKVNEKDIEKMEYLNAFTKELLRKHPPTYFLLTHAVTRPTTLAGYDVPEHTNVEFFSAGISDDSTVWVDPMEFNPDRFLSDKEDADITGVKGVKMMPFGVGRRICPCLGLGTTHISLMIARMVQEFDWSAPPNVRTLDFSEKLEFSSQW